MIQKTAKIRSTRTDYSALLDTIRKETYDGAIRDFESRTDALKKEKEKATKTRTTKNKTNEQRRTAKRRPRKGRWGKRWPGDDWVNWRKQQETKDAPTTDTKNEAKTDKEKQTTKKADAK